MYSNEDLYPLLVNGGVLIIDDYGHFEGAKKAVDEYLSFIEKYENNKTKEKLLNPVWHIHKGSPPKEKIIMPFSMLLNIVGSSNAKDKDVLWKFIKKFHNEIEPKNHKILDVLS